MLLINDPKDAPAGPKVVVVGSFDGLHLGHQHLIRQAQQEARSGHLPVLVYTFDPPSKVFTRGEGFLTELSEKVELLKSLGAEIALVVPFNEDFSKRSKDEFLADLKDLEAHTLYVGRDFRFGHQRSGGPEDLSKVAPTRVVDLLHVAGAPVKSSRVRELLATGRVEEAKELLGRPYRADGIVVEGDKLGRTLGFPTANLQVAPLKVLPHGVFAVRVRTDSETYGGVANVGLRPTVGGRSLRFEVHVLDFDGDLYGHELKVEFLKKIRDEAKFEDLEALKSQLAKDAEAAKRYLGT
ncbi:MAG: riboflavin biosynthesis protein RibF [Deinococcus sp.]|nr:riboflavin biosynthesis protein RibF [Deinococcus sp.]MCL5964573.1 riboflavin biosynthesis protein RibF [Deinococcus sp.]